MAVKTFTAGEVLTASDTNTYLANSGLVYIKETVQSSSTEIDVLSCFSSAYDSYRVVVSGYKTTGGADVLCRLISGTNTVQTAGYYCNMIYNQSWTSLSLAATGSAGGANTYFWTGSIASTGQVGFAIDVFGPYKTDNTTYSSLGGVGASAWQTFRSAQGSLFDSTQYTGIRIYGGTITGGVVRVYGYRQA